MKSTTFALGSLLAGMAIAQPHRHQHAALHHKRADQPVVWTTEVEYVYETVGVTTTIWVSEGQDIPTVAPASSTKTSEAVPAQFFEPKSSAKSSTPIPTPTPSSTPVYVAPAPTSTYVAPIVEAVAAPVVVESSSAAAVTTVAPVEAYVAPVVAPVVAEVTTSAAAAVSSVVADVSSDLSSATGSESADCESSGALCGGDLTFYDPVMESWGACGWHNDGLKEKVIALPVGLMGDQSNGNPYCGREVTILHKGKKTIAKVVDKCMGCKGRDIDISRLAFDDLEDQGIGRTTATWYFSS